MIGEYGMRPVLGGAARHVAAYAIRSGWMRSGEFAFVARLAPAVGSRRWRRVRVVARSTPYLALTSARAGAQCQLLCMTDYFQATASRTRVDREHFFERLTWMEVGKIFARV